MHYFHFFTIIDHWDSRSHNSNHSRIAIASYLLSVCLSKIVSSITLTSESSSQQQHTMSHNKVLNQLSPLLHFTQGQVIFTPITDIWHFSFQNIGPLPQPTGHHTLNQTQPNRSAAMLYREQETSPVTIFLAPHWSAAKLPRPDWSAGVAASLFMFESLP